MSDILRAADSIQHAEISAAERRYVELLEVDDPTPAAAGELHALMVRLGKSLDDARRDATTIRSYVGLFRETGIKEFAALRSKLDEANAAIDRGNADRQRITQELNARQGALVADQMAVTAAVEALGVKSAERNRLQEANRDLLQHTSVHREKR